LCGAYNFKQQIKKGGGVMGKQKILILFVLGIFLVIGYYLDAKTCPRGTTNCVSGTVTDRSGAGVGNVIVKAYEGNKKIKEAQTDSNGGYCLTGLTSGEKYTIKCQGKSRNVTVPSRYCGKVNFRI
jgi:hypothetical protein